MTTTETVITAEQAYRNTLAGIGSCATACGCCAMHARIAQEALARTYPVIRRETTGPGFCAVEYLPAENTTPREQAEFNYRQGFAP